MHRYWLYGAVIDPTPGSHSQNPEDVPPARKGWFPRRCAVEIIDAIQDSELDDDEDCEHIEEHSSGHCGEVHNPGASVTDNGKKDN